MTEQAPDRDAPVEEHREFAAGAIAEQKYKLEPDEGMILSDEVPDDEGPDEEEADDA